LSDEEFAERHGFGLTIVANVEFPAAFDPRQDPNFEQLRAMSGERRAAWFEAFEAFEGPRDADGGLHGLLDSFTSGCRGVFSVAFEPGDDNPFDLWSDMFERLQLDERYVAAQDEFGACMLALGHDVAGVMEMLQAIVVPFYEAFPSDVGGEQPLSSAEIYSLTDEQLEARYPTRTVETETMLRVRNEYEQQLLDDQPGVFTER
jgi:hypothetical protein